MTDLRLINQCRDVDWVKDVNPVPWCWLGYRCESSAGMMTDLTMVNQYRDVDLSVVVEPVKFSDDVAVEESSCWMSVAPPLVACSWKSPEKWKNPLFTWWSNNYKERLDLKVFYTNGPNGNMEMLSFMTIPYDYYGPINYICTYINSLDRGMDSGLRKESPDLTPNTEHKLASN